MTCRVEVQRRRKEFKFNSVFNPFTPFKFKFVLIRDDYFTYAFPPGESMGKLSEKTDKHSGKADKLAGVWKRNFALHSPPFASLYVPFASLSVQFGAFKIPPKPCFWLENAENR